MAPDRPHRIPSPEFEPSWPNNIAVPPNRARIFKNTVTKSKKNVAAERRASSYASNILGSVACDAANHAAGRTDSPLRETVEDPNRNETMPAMLPFDHEPSDYESDITIYKAEHLVEAARRRRAENPNGRWAKMTRPPPRQCPTSGCSNIVWRPEFHLRVLARFRPREGVDECHECRLSLKDDGSPPQYFLDHVTRRRQFWMSRWLKENEDHPKAGAVHEAVGRRKQSLAAVEEGGEEVHGA